MKAYLVNTAVAAAASAMLLGCSPTDARNDAGAPAASVEDDRVETYVRARFQADDSIRANDIDVTAQNGRVTLRGTVPTEDARQRAVSAAREASGVRSIDDQIVVAAVAAAPAAAPEAATAGRVPPAAQTDRASDPGWITTKIRAQYFINREISPWNIDVTTAANGVVTLRGVIDEPGDRDEAVRIARGVDGVTQVNDRLVLQADAARKDADNNATEPDAWLTAKIQAGYFMDAEVKGRDIDVDARNGSVTLRGQVSSEAERRQAVAIARNTDGVADVVDQLTVARPADSSGSGTGLSQVAATVDDAWITTKVQSKFFLDRDIKGNTITVNTSGGVVTLEGSVRSAAERQAAQQIAQETDGVSRVNNQLKVSAGR